MLHVYICILPNDFLLNVLDAHMFSHNGYLLGTIARSPKAAGSGHINTYIICCHQEGACPS